MTILQLLIIMNYTRRIISFLRVNCIFIRYFWYGTHPTRPIKDGEFYNPVRPNPNHGWSMSNSYTRPTTVLVVGSRKVWRTSKTEAMSTKDSDDDGHDDDDESNRREEHGDVDGGTVGPTGTRRCSTNHHASSHIARLNTLIKPIVKQ